MSNLKILPLMLLVLGQGAIAQTLPNSGSQIQQIPPAPALQRAPLQKLEIERPGESPGTPANTARIVVNSLTVIGTRAFPPAELIALTGFKPGTELSLADLREMAQRITEHYRRNGYFVAQAYLPVQDINNGAVTIAVIEGRYGKISLQNKSNLSDGLAYELLRGLDEGAFVRSEPLENRLLLLSDLPGVKVRSTLVPGAVVGTSDLIVDVAPGERVTGSIDADNAGNRYTGEYRLGATINLNNPAGRGDVASLRVLTAGSGLNYARASYQMQFGKAAIGAAYSALNYSLGREFAPLGAGGTAQVASIFGIYPLIRSRNARASVRLAFEDRTFHDHVDSTASVTDKRARVLIASLSGEERDTQGGNGVTGYALTFTTGNLDIQTPAVRAFDALNARSNGRYNKISVDLMRLQNVTNTVSLYGSVRAQLASKNLDSSEKMELGGMYGVRAYPEGEAYADEGYLLTLEARVMLPALSNSMRNPPQLVAFVDGGGVATNAKPWVAGPNTRHLSGAGVGVNWAVTDDLIVRAYYARKVGSGPALSAPDKSGRFWIQAVKYF